MNTDKVKNTKLKSLYYFPLTPTKRVFTVNYMNMTVILPANEAALLNFIIKESTIYNTFRYSTMLLKKYRLYMKAIGANGKIKTNIHAAREIFIRLIEKGLVFRVDGLEYVVNFALTYHPKFEKAANKWSVGYQEAFINRDYKEKRDQLISDINQQIIKEIKK